MQPPISCVTEFKISKEQSPSCNAEFLDLLLRHCSPISEISQQARQRRTTKKLQVIIGWNLKLEGTGARFVRGMLVFVVLCITWTFT